MIIFLLIIIPFLTATVSEDFDACESEIHICVSKILPEGGEGYYFTSINEAIHSVTIPGTIISIRQGTYNEAITIDNTIEGYPGENKYNIVDAYPGEEVTIIPPTGASVPIINVRKKGWKISSGNGYMTIRNDVANTNKINFIQSTQEFIIYDVNIDVMKGNFGSIILTKNAPLICAFVRFTFGDDVQNIDNVIKISEAGDDNLVENCYFYNVVSKKTVIIEKTNNVFVTANYFNKNNVRDFNCFVVLSNSETIWVYNNIFHFSKSYIETSGNNGMLWIDAGPESSISEITVVHNHFILDGMFENALIDITRVTSTLTMNVFEFSNNYISGQILGPDYSSISYDDSISFTDSSFQSNLFNITASDFQFVQTGGLVMSDNKIGTLNIYGEGDKPVPFYRIVDSKWKGVVNTVVLFDFDLRERKDEFHIGAFQYQSECGNTNWDDESDCVICKNHWKNRHGDCLMCQKNFDSSTDCKICINKWAGSECTICPGNYDVDKNCNGCINKFTDKNDNCTTCPDNWNPTTGCLECRNHWYDENNNNCHSCPPNWDQLEDCNSCSNHWYGEECNLCQTGFDPQKNCDVCLGGLGDILSCDTCYSRNLYPDQLDYGMWDETKSCQKCLNHYSIESGCLTCDVRWDITSHCSTCMGKYSGPSCEKCDAENMLDDCETCAGYWKKDSAGDCLICDGNFNSNCSQCKPPWINEASGCINCEVGYAEPECAVCLGNRDIGKKCAECKNKWYDLDSNCNKCPNDNFDKNCNGCKDGTGWSGSNCSKCQKNFKLMETEQQNEIGNGTKIILICEECITGFAKTDEGCNVCADGYTTIVIENELICEKTSSSTDIATFVITVTVIGFFLIILGIIITLVVVIYLNKHHVKSFMAEYLKDTKVGDFLDEKLKLYDEERVKELLDEGDINKTLDIEKIEDVVEDEKKQKVVVIKSVPGDRKRKKRTKYKHGKDKSEKDSHETKAKKKKEKEKEKEKVVEVKNPKKESVKEFLIRNKKKVNKLKQRTAALDRSFMEGNREEKDVLTPSELDSDSSVYSTSTYTDSTEEEEEEDDIVGRGKKSESLKYVDKFQPVKQIIKNDLEEIGLNYVDGHISESGVRYNETDHSKFKPPSVPLPLPPSNDNDNNEKVTKKKPPRRRRKKKGMKETIGKDLKDGSTDTPKKKRTSNSDRPKKKRENLPVKD